MSMRTVCATRHVLIQATCLKTKALQPFSAMVVELLQTTQPRPLISALAAPSTLAVLRLRVVGERCLVVLAHVRSLSRLPLCRES